ncbi:MAG: acyltransferase [Pedococcus sp.]
MPRTDPTTPPPGSTGTAAVSRLRALDGLRGVAAVVVLLHHAFLTVPALARPYYVAEAADRDSPLVWALIHTPLHLAWAGTEAVYVFFVLSGLVLALPVLRSASSFSWLEYFPRRAARLYLPIVAAVLWGLLLVWLVPRDNTASRGLWMRARPNEASWSGVAHDLTLLGGESHLISPLWSLQWELWFSLLLPLYVLGAVLSRRLPVWVPVAGLVGMVTAGVFVHSRALVHLPMFAIGVIVASRLPELAHRAAPIRSRGWATIAVGATVLITSHWWLLAMTTNTLVLRLTTPLALLGATGYVLTVAFCPQARRWLETTPIQWLGTISFSLYLVHEPIVVALAFLLGPGSGPLLVVLAIPISLLAGWLFYRLVELPAHHASRRFGRWVAQHLRSASSVHRPTQPDAVP